MTEIKITEIEFTNWKQSPVTRIFLAAIAEMLARKEKEMGKGCMFDYDHADRTQALTGVSVGYCTALTEVLDIGPVKVRVKKSKRQ